MRAWAFMLGGILVWAADFFLLYGIASVALTTPIARILSLVVTAAALAADVWLFLLARARHRSAETDYERWFAGLATLTAAVSAVAVSWQGLPALLV